MNRLSVIFYLLMIFVGTASGQTVKGHIYDAKTSEPLIGASVSYEFKGVHGVVSDIDGAYLINIPEGGQYLIFSYVGYESVRMPIVISKNEVLTKDVYMKEATNLLEDVVVTAGRFEQKLSDVTVSMELLKADAIQRQAPTDMSAALQTLPGVDIVDKQPSIRGGGGWTYSVGARSQILIDGTSALNPKTGEINWNIIPMENVEQVEVIKGASSVLYGSSALNGIINIRTARPGLIPKTTASLYVGIYGDPANEEYQWSDKSFWKEDKYPVQPFLRRNIFSGVRNPMYEGLDVSHSRRIGDFDVTGGLNVFTDEGFRQQNFNKRFRLGGNITYHQPNMGEKVLNYGFNMNFLSNEYGDFFIWRSPKEPYKPSPFANMGRQENNIRFDPFLNFTNPEKGISHKIKGRVFYSNDNIGNPTSSASIMDILGNMGTDAQVIQNMINGDLSVLDPLLEGVLGGLVNGDLETVVSGALTSLKDIFPTAQTDDYCDLIAWLMKNGLPSDIGSLLDGKVPSDLIPWLSGVMNPEEKNKISKTDENYNYFLDYQFNKKWEDIGGQMTTGVTYEHTRNYSASMDEVHKSDNVAAFLQYDQRLWDRLNISAGMRTEYYRIDDHYREAETKVFGAKIPFRPVFRAGLNYQLADYSYLRASFGQGYRNPSIVEKFLHKDIGGAAVYPNPEVKAEKGVNAEIGFKQGYKFGKVMGMFDIAGFYTQYKDMLEFQFGIFDNSSLTMINSTQDAINMILGGGGFGVGAQFHNVSKAQIYGMEISTNGVYDITPGTRLVYNVGYVYTEPRDADYKERKAMEDQYTDPLQMKEKSNDSKYLKYRPKHSFKTTFDIEWKRMNLGMNVAWKSKILAVDYIMVDERPKEKAELMDYVRAIMLGSIDGESMHTYWKKHNTDYATVDFRFGIKATKEVGFQLLVNNLFNKEYSYRPMAVGAPRTFVVKMNISL